jgi:hypothetical protein
VRRCSAIQILVSTRSATWHIAQRPALALTISGVSAQISILHTIPYHVYADRTYTAMPRRLSIKSTKLYNLPESSYLADRVGACVSVPSRCTCASVNSVWRYTLKENYGAGTLVEGVLTGAHDRISCCAGSLLRRCAKLLYGLCICPAAITCLNHSSPSEANLMSSPSDSRFSALCWATTPTQ